MLIITIALTDSSNFQKYLKFWGNGSNGKSTITSLIQNAFGDYCVTADYQALANGTVKGNNATPELASIIESRVAVVPELPKGTKYNESLIKNTTGGENISYRRLFEDRQQRRCNSLMIFATNNLFDMSGITDHGSWRRPELHKFKKKFVKDPDPDNEYELKEDIHIATKWVHDPDVVSGFFALIVKFYEICVNEYGGYPYSYESKVMDYELQEYRNESDYITQFITKRVVKSKIQENKGDEDEEKVMPISIKEFCDRYNEWADTEYGNVIPDSELVKYFLDSSIRKNIFKMAKNAEYVVKDCRPLTKEEMMPSDNEEWFGINDRTHAQDKLETPEQSWERFLGMVDNLPNEDVDA